MSFRVRSCLFLCFCLLILPGCGQDSSRTKNNNEGRYVESLHANKSCQEISIFRDLSFSGKFFYHAVKCFSKKDSNGGDVLKGSIKLVNTIGIQGLQDITDFLLISPSNSKEQKVPPEYPLIKLIMVLLERGTYINGSSSSDLITKRFGPLQGLLEDLNPYWMVNLVLQMSETGALNKLLDDVSQLLEQIDERSFFALYRSYLSNETLRQSINLSLTTPMKKVGVYSAAKNILTIENSKNISEQAQKTCFQQWLDPEIIRSSSDSLRCYSDSTNDETVIRQTGKDRYQELLDSLGETGINKLKDVLVFLSNNFLTMDQAERATIMSRIYQSLGPAYQEQDGIIRHLIALANFFSRTKVTDFKEVIECLDKMLDKPEARPVQHFNIKIGSAKLYNLMEQTIYNGGAITGCPGLSLPGLNQLADRRTDEDMQLWFNAFYDFLSPNSACGKNLSPLASQIISHLEEGVGCNEEQRNRSDADRFCLKKQEISALSEKLQSFNWQRFRTVIKPDSNLLKDFVLYVLEDVKSELEKDSLALRWLHLSQSEVVPEKIDLIIKMVRDYRELTPKILADLDQKLEQNVELQRYLLPNFLENILNKKINDLVAVLEQFDGLLDKGADLKTHRVFAGIYNYGPIEGLISHLSYIDELKKYPLLNANMPEDYPRIKELLARMRFPGALYYNNRLHTSDQIIDYKFLGELSRSVKFTSSKFKFTGRYPLKVKEIFNSGGNTFLRYRNILEYGILLGKDVKTNQADAFVEWVQDERNKNGATSSTTTEDQVDKLYEWYADYQTWVSLLAQTQMQNQINNKRLPFHFFESEQYSSGEFRKLAMFYSIHYLMAPGFFPEVNNTFRQGSNRNFKKQLLTIPAYQGRNWSSYLEYFPAFVDQALTDRKQTFSQLLSNAPYKAMNESSFNQIYGENPWQLSLDEQEGVYKLQGFDGDQLEVIKLLTTTNLLTYHKKEYYYLPLIGMAEHCHDVNGNKTDCPLTFQDYLADDGTQYRKYDELKKYLEKILLSYFCPYLSSGHGFSENFVREMEKRLSLRIADTNLVSFCTRSDINLFITKLKPVDLFPRWVQERIIDDLYKMGKNPKLKPGLDNLVAQIRYHKVQKKYSKNSFLFARDWMNSPGGLPYLAQAYSYKAISHTRGFLSFFPGRLNSYLNLIRAEVSSESIFKNAMDRWGAELRSDQERQEGLVYKFADDFLINVAKEAQERNDSLLDFFLELAHQLKNRSEYQRMTSYLMTRPSDVESFPIIIDTLQFFFTRLRDRAEEQGRELHWTDKDLIIFKQFLHQENFWAIHQFGRNFSSQDFIRAIDVALGALAKTGDNYQQSSLLINKILAFLEKEFTAINSDNKGIAKIIERNLLTILNQNYDENFYYAISTFLDSLGEIHQDFSSQDRPSIHSQLDPIIKYIISAFPRLLALYQDHFKQDKSNNDDYFKRMFLSMIEPFSGEYSVQGAPILADFLQDSRLGSWETLYKPFLFDPILQPKLLSIFKTVNVVPRTTLQEALQESYQLLPRTHNMLNFIVKNAEWDENVSTDTIDAIKGLARLSSPGNQLWEKQIFLMNSWLSLSSL